MLNTVFLANILNSTFSQEKTKPDKESEKSYEELKAQTIEKLNALVKEYPGKKLPYELDISVYGIGSYTKYITKALEEKNLDDLYKYQRRIFESFKESMANHRAYKNLALKNETHKEKAEQFYLLGSVYYEMLRIIKPVCIKSMESAAKEILPHSSSGKFKYPEAHTIFAANLQDFDIGAAPIPDDINPEEFFKDYAGDFSNIEFGNYYIKNLATQIILGKGTIEEAAIKVGAELRGSDQNPVVPLHRIGKSARTAEETDFNVLIVIGSPKREDVEGDKKLHSASLHTLKNAIQRRYGKKCKHFEFITEPYLEDLRAKFQEISDSLKTTNRKLYVIYIGHGLSNSIDEGISAKNKNMQGAKALEIEHHAIDREEGLTEKQIKLLYNVFLQNIETISIFPNCQSGAAVTSICYERLDTVA
jgi:hypothetical protein